MDKKKDRIEYVNKEEAKKLFKKYDKDKGC